MYQVAGEYPDYQKPGLKGRFFLTADQPFNPTTWEPPIHWEGRIGDTKVKFVQIDSSGLHLDCYDWTDFPEELEYVRGYLVVAIDDAMRVMD